MDEKRALDQERFASVAIVITASIYALFAIWLGCSPVSLLRGFGIESETPSMLTEIRAFYGGVQLGIAAAMLWLLRERNLKAALLIGGLPLVGSASGRVIGLCYDGFSAMHLSFAVFEILGASICLAAYAFPKTVRRGDSPRD